MGLQLAPRPWPGVRHASLASWCTFLPRSIAWRSGQLIFREEPLRYAVEDVNRYSSKPIVLADERIGDIRISGTVLDRGVPGWLDSLESAFGLEAREEEERIVLERARR